MSKTLISKNQSFVLALPIFPGRHQPSIVGRNELNYRVRNGNGWTLVLISTNYRYPSYRRTYILYTFLSALSSALSPIFKPAKRLKIGKEKQRRNCAFAFMRKRMIRSLL